MGTERYTREINGNTYNIVLQKGFLRWKIVIGNRYSNRGGTYWRPKDVSHSIWFPDESNDEAELIGEMLNRAVCKREEKVESEEQYEDRINSRLDIVAEEHESS